MKESKKSDDRNPILLVDALINLFLGIVLIIFSDGIVRAFGIPGSMAKFYPNIIGAILLGITIALIIEYFRKPGGLVGLGLGGAVAINLCGGIALALWLMFGDLGLTARGQIILWILVVLLIAISLAELAFQQVKSKTKSSDKNI